MLTSDTPRLRINLTWPEYVEIIELTTNNTHVLLTAEWLNEQGEILTVSDVSRIQDVRVVIEVPYPGDDAIREWSLVISRQLQNVELRAELIVWKRIFISYVAPSTSPAVIGAVLVSITILGYCIKGYITVENSETEIDGSQDFLLLYFYCLPQESSLDLQCPLLPTGYRGQHQQTIWMSHTITRDFQLNTTDSTSVIDRDYNIRMDIHTSHGLWSAIYT